MAMSQILSARPSVASDLSTANEELLRLCEAKDRFVAVAGHELRNVLSPIVTSLVYLVGHTDDDNRAELLRIAAQHAQQLSRLIDDLFDASRLASGNVQLCKEVVDVRVIAERSIQAFAPAIRLREQQLRVTRCASPLWLNADPLRIEQVFLNLLNNAVKFTPEGGSIWFQQQRENNFAVFQIKDSGCGIRSEQLPFIFDFYSRAETGNGHASSGLGIGLAVVKSLVELHEGNIEAHSDGSGCGADFTVRLPLHWQ